MTSRSSCLLLAATVGLVGTLTVMPGSAALAADQPSPDRQAAGGKAPSHQAVAISRAVGSYQALRRYLGTSDGSGLYRERYPVAAGDNPYSYEWPYSQLHVATVDLAGMPGGYGRAFREDLAAGVLGQERYWQAAGGTTGLAGYASYPIAPYGGGGDFFYDDNEWVGLLDVQKYLMSGDRAALNRAKQLFDLVRSGWDADTSHPAPGGVFWTQATWSTDRNTVSNMPGAELGLRLYQITGQKSYLEFSLRMYEWTNQYLQSPSGLYWDHLNLAGTVEKTFWSYNQGVPVGVNVLLYRATHDRVYLERAQRIAAAAYDYYVTQGKLAQQPAFFNSIFFKNLLLLESVTGGHAYRDAMSEYAAQMWDTKRDPATGLFVFNADGSTELLQQAAMVQIYAVLGWSRNQDSILY